MLKELKKIATEVYKELDSSSSSTAAIATMKTVTTRMLSNGMKLFRLPDLHCSSRMVRMKSLPDFPGLNKMMMRKRTLMMTLMMKIQMMRRKMKMKMKKKKRKMIGLVSQKGEENFSILTTMMNKFKFYCFNCYILTTCE